MLYELINHPIILYLCNFTRCTFYCKSIINGDDIFPFHILLVLILSNLVVSIYKHKSTKDIDYCILAYYRKIVLLLHINRSNYLFHKFICNVLKIRLYSYFRAKVFTSHAMAQCRFRYFNVD